MSDEKPGREEWALTVMHHYSWFELQARLHARDDSEAEDLISEAMATALAMDPPVDKSSAWLRGLFKVIVVRRAIDMQRGSGGERE